MGRGTARLCALAVAMSALCGAARAALTGDAGFVVQQVIGARDNDGLPFAVVDKKAARLWLFDPAGAPLAEVPVLLGLAVGDASVPDIGTRPLAKIRPAERTTPAGRFLTEPGRNIDGEAIVWVDYDAAFAIHRLRPGPARERRAQRLASARPADHRISLGCIVLAPETYDAVIAPVLGRSRGVVYVLPERRDVRSWFTAAAAAP